MEKTRVRSVNSKVSVMDYVINTEMLPFENRISFFGVFECQKWTCGIQIRKNRKKSFQKGIKNPIFEVVFAFLDTPIFFVKKMV